MRRPLQISFTRRTQGTNTTSPGWRRWKSTSAATRSVTELADALKNNSHNAKDVAAALAKHNPQEFRAWETGFRRPETPVESVVKPPARHHPMSDYAKLYLRTALPFFGFGVCDNIIMITVGDVIDNHFGVIMGFSTMVAAGLGQAVSDGSGITIQQLIERWADKLGLPDHHFTAEELSANSMLWLLQVFRTIGIVCGCLCGLVPLILTDTGNKPRLYDTLLQALPEEKRRQLSTKAVRVSFADGEKLLVYGAEATGLYMVTHGQVKVVGRGGPQHADPVLICEQEPGSTLGVLELAFGHPCVADVVAEGPVKALFISREAYNHVMGGTVAEETKKAVEDYIKEDPIFAPYRLHYGSRGPAPTIGSTSSD
jgi:hypothetical protein